MVAHDRLYSPGNKTYLVYLDHLGTRIGAQVFPIGIMPPQPETELVPVALHAAWSLLDAALFDHARLQAKFPLVARAPASTAYDRYNPDVNGREPTSSIWTDRLQHQWCDIRIPQGDSWPRPPRWVDIVPRIVG